VWTEGFWLGKRATTALRPRRWQSVLGAGLDFQRADGRCAAVRDVVVYTNVQYMSSGFCVCLDGKRQTRGKVGLAVFAEDSAGQTSDADAAAIVLPPLFLIARDAAISALRS
jgi:hypothetical protein